MSRAGFDVTIGCHLSAPKNEVTTTPRPLAPTARHDLPVAVRIARATTTYARRTAPRPARADSPRSTSATSAALVRHGLHFSSLPSTTALHGWLWDTKVPHGALPTITGGRHEVVAEARSGFWLPLAPRAARRGGSGEGWSVAAAV